MGCKKSKFPDQRNIRFSKKDVAHLSNLAKELNCSFSDAVRRCVQYTFEISPILKELTLWDAIMNLSPECFGTLTEDREEEDGRST
jgi:hypothetical protein